MFLRNICEKTHYSQGRVSSCVPEEIPVVKTNLKRRVYLHPGTSCARLVAVLLYWLYLVGETRLFRCAYATGTVSGTLTVPETGTAETFDTFLLK